jgi:uncharacterized protein (DUF1501 family)
MVLTQPQTFLTGEGDQRRALVVIFLRGAADGLHLVAPLQDDGYYRARPRIALTRKEAVPLDGFFGLHPRLKELAPIFHQGQLAIIHAAGSEDSTRSHFEAQELMEHGGVVAGGWLARFLRARTTGAPGPLAAVALGRAVPECLRGAPSATVFQSLDDFSLGRAGTRLVQSLARLYQAEGGLLGSAGCVTVEALQRIETLRQRAYEPAHGARYGNTEFARNLLQVARLIKARVGLEAASIDLGGWDSHFSQGTLIEPLMARLASGLAAFYQDLGPEMRHTTVVVMTEFGRRVEENSAFGTDHGRGSVMFVMGGGIKGGRVLGKWPGLTREVLEGPGDLPVVQNYRNILAPILYRHGLPAESLAQVFPEFEFAPVDLFG